MKVHRIRQWATFTLALMLGATCALAKNSAQQDGAATRALKRLVAADPEFERLLVASIESAKRANPDRLTNPAQSLDEYFEFISRAERGMPGDVLSPPTNSTLYQRLDQSLGYLYFIADQPLEELKGRGYFNNSLQYVEPFATWNRGFVRAWGAFLNSPESWNEEYLRLAQADPTHSGFAASHLRQ